jgi:hypothetical protein
MIWNILTAIGTLVSMLAYVVTALYIRAELKAVEKDRYLTVTSELFTNWQNLEFMEAQMWVMYKLQEKTWDAFVSSHRGDYGEIAFHRVGSFYDRVGTLIEMKLINEKELLSTLGGYAIAVWKRIEPLVLEARKVENSALFDSFEKMLPACYECYVPSLAGAPAPEVKPFKVNRSPALTSVEKLKSKIDMGEPITVLDVRQSTHLAEDPRKIPGEVYIPPDEIDKRYLELPADKEIDVFCA